MDDLMNHYIYFIHIPRTGGKSLTRFFRDSKFQIKSVHFPRDFLQIHHSYTLKNESNRFITILRNPVMRQMSEWKKYGHDVIDKRFNVPEYMNAFHANDIVDLESFLACPLTHDMQTKVLSGHQPYSRVYATTKDADAILERIHNDKIIPILFEEIPTYINRVRQETDSTDKSDLSSPMFEPSNMVDTYLYDTVVNKYKEKTQRGLAILDSIHSSVRKD